MRQPYTADDHGRYAERKLLRHMRNMKILFLDVDGVLNNQESLRTGSGVDFTGWDPLCCEVVRQMCLQFDLQIVVSSTWRLNWGDCMWNMGRASLDKPIDRTNELVGEPRGSEIAEWLSRHPRVAGYIILDDDMDFSEIQREHHIHTNIKDGVRPAHMAIARQILAKGMP